MDPTPLRVNTRPEAKTQRKIIKYLEDRGWFVRATHGNAYQSGFPDLYCAHKIFRARWIEVKNKEKYEFTKAQIETFPLMEAAGVGIWVLVAATETEYLKLFHEPNWHLYLPVNKIHTRTVIKTPSAGEAYVPPKVIHRLTRPKS